jgi:hypothetical protein
MNNNIEMIWKLATPKEVYNGVKWYSDAQYQAKEISMKYDIKLSTVVGVISALSPNNKWDRNIQNADALIKAYLDGEHIESVKVSTYHTMKAKAWSILDDMLSSNEDILTRLNGQKIKSFYECIMGFDACCIDGHALNIWRGERFGLTSDKTNIGKKLYAEIQNDYVNTANELGLKAYELQAITWVAWRRIHEIA